MTAIRTVPFPVIAQIQGLATAAGCQLAATCDIVIASENSKFSTPGASVGLFCSTPGIAVARAVPRKMSSYMLFTGLAINATDALKCGLVSKVVPDDKLDEETKEVISAILSKSRSVIALGKKFYYEQLEKDIQSAYREGEKVMVENLELKDAQEGLSAFIEKRKPVWINSSEKFK
ncbi:enoyl-CoA hydratase domain-containing protein 3, mitochondrial-like [Centruroides sculpturatus]|uniref:enoyl-CoA hydratase domain-containing protein 3, mitochondrial-like n=1 Tax=Centruroides sculpturatus TaxID=218467 RepID=UPI000C6E84AA|nr:enoyl-CoA hydratase domain-containing protein 3, mitochondrial-like [Centruroides sculpturatus]